MTPEIKIITAKKLSSAQYKMMESLQKDGKVRITDGNQRTYRKLMEYGLLEYHGSYDFVIPTAAGKKMEL